MPCASTCCGKVSHLHVLCHQIREEHRREQQGRSGAGEKKL
jgi:hypothetical protein